MVLLLSHHQSLRRRWRLGCQNSEDGLRLARCLSYSLHCAWNWPVHRSFFLEWSHWLTPYTTASPIWSQVPYSPNLGFCLGIFVMACAWDDLTLVWVACCFSVADSCGCYLMDSQMALSFPELWFVFQSQVPFSFDSVKWLHFNMTTNNLWNWGCTPM